MVMGRSSDRKTATGLYRVDHLQRFPIFGLSPRDFRQLVSESVFQKLIVRAFLWLMADARIYSAPSSGFTSGSNTPALG